MRYFQLQYLNIKVLIIKCKKIYNNYNKESSRLESSNFKIIKIFKYFNNNFFKSKKLLKQEIKLINI